MDSEVKFYLDKFKREGDSLAEAITKRMEWSDKENRHQANLKSALQLLTDRALEVGEALPQDVLMKASSILGTSVYQEFQGRNLVSVPTISAAAIQPATPPSIHGAIGVSVSDTLALADASEINRVEWIEGVVEKSSPKGITPPEIMKLATESGVNMHENYPYVVLKKLIKKGKIRREGSRYFCVVN